MRCLACLNDQSMLYTPRSALASSRIAGAKAAPQHALLALSLFLQPLTQPRKGRWITRMGSLI